MTVRSRVTFDLTIIDDCAGNVITSDSNWLNDQTYYLGGDELTVSP